VYDIDTVLLEPDPIDAVLTVPTVVAFAPLALVAR